MQDLKPIGKMYPALNQPFCTCKLPTLISSTFFELPFFGRPRFAFGTFLARRTEGSADAGSSDTETGPVSFPFSAPFSISVSTGCCSTVLIVAPPSPASAGTSSATT